SRARGGHQRPLGPGAPPDGPGRRHQQGERTRHHAAVCGDQQAVGAALAHAAADVPAAAEGRLPRGDGGAAEEGRGCERTREELADVNARDADGYTALHYAAARGDNETILYLVEHGADVLAVARNGQTTVDMANGPVQRYSPFPETVALLEKMGAKNNHKCVS